MALWYVLEVREENASSFDLFDQNGFGYLGFFIVPNKF
jgi:hypothetical protein